MTTKILVLESNPQDTAQLLLNREIREIEDALERGKNREQFVLRWRMSPCFFGRHVREFFPDAEAVNHALRTLIHLMGL